MCEKLRGCDYYDPLFLTDEEMGINAFGESLGYVCFLIFFQRADDRDKFCKELSKGITVISIHMYGNKNNSSPPDCLYIWKVPHKHGKTHGGLVAMTVNECQDSAHKKVGHETIWHFNSIIKRITEVPVGVTEALHNYLFIGDPDLDKTIAKE